MIARQDNWLVPLLRCPDCSSALTHSGAALACAACGFESLAGHDLRPHAPQDAILRVRRAMKADPGSALRTIDLDTPAITYDGPMPGRDSRELMSEIALRLKRRGDLLDLGCGGRDQAIAVQHLGHQYVGVDFSDERADFLADAHALPFANDSFDCILSYAVLEHLHHPFLALHEVSRVLRPGGWFVGTVSQGEPFHNSYFHHTPWALMSLLDEHPELRLARIWPADDTLASLATMGRYSRVLRLLLRGIAMANARLPWLTPRKMAWPLVDRQLDRLYRAGSVCFSIEKLPRQAEVAS